MTDPQAVSITWVELLTGDTDLSRYAREALRGDWTYDPEAFARAEFEGAGWQLMAGWR